MPTIYIRGANTTAQWYQDNYSGTTFSRIDKFLIHTTETGGWPGYSAGASAPNATYYPKWRQIRQHFGINRSARALRDPSSTLVRENRDNVFQLEVICYSQYSLAVERGGLWVGDLTANHLRDIAAIALQCHRDWGLPLTSSVTWREGRKTWYNDVRLTGSQYDAYRGILGHVHASGNDHWDPGGFRYSRFKDALSYQLVNHPVYGGGTTIPPAPTPTPTPPTEDDMPLSPEDKTAIRSIVQEELTRNYLHPGPPETNVSTHHGGRYGFLAASKADEILQVLKATPPAVDVDALAAAIVAKMPTAPGSIDLATVKQGVSEVLTEGVGGASS